MYHVCGSDNTVYCYAELTVSSPLMAEIIVCIHYDYPRRDGQAEWPE